MVFMHGRKHAGWDGGPFCSVADQAMAIRGASCRLVVYVSGCSPRRPCCYIAGTLRYLELYQAQPGVVWRKTGCRAINVYLDVSCVKHLNARGGLPRRPLAIGRWDEMR